MTGKLADDEEHAKDARDGDRDVPALLVVRSSAWFGTLIVFLPALWSSRV
jgi:hypothetical protein